MNRFVILLSIATALILVSSQVFAQRLPSIQSTMPKSEAIHKKNQVKNEAAMDAIRLENSVIDWSAEDMMQHQIDEEINRRKNRGLGEMCSFSEDCSSGCCLIDRKTHISSCQPKAFRGERCTYAQIKGNKYVDACPCVSGTDFCPSPGGICNA